MSESFQEGDPPTIASDRDLRDLAHEQAALQRVATLVARQATPAEVFATVAKEAALTLNVAMVSIVRYEPHSMAVQVGAWEVGPLVRARHHLADRRAEHLGTGLRFRGVGARRRVRRGSR